MMRFLHIFAPKRIGTQIALLVVASLVLAHLAIMAFFVATRDGSLPRYQFGPFERLMFAARVIDAEPDSNSRARLRTAMLRADTALMVLDSAPDPGPDTVWPSTETPFYFARDPSRGTHRLAVIKLADGVLLASALKPPPGRPFPPPGTIIPFAFLASALTLLSLWAARQLTAPLARLADSAENFSAAGFHRPLPETGPLEIKLVSQSLNRMQERLLGFVQDRTRMLAAISHDLRTPITRLRLLAEDIVDAKLQGQVMRNLATMEHLTRSALWFLRGELESPLKVKADLPALTQTVCDEFVDGGQPVQYSGVARISINCNPDELMRAMQNLIDNGLKFGSSVDVRVIRDGPNAVVEIQDNGPGIQDHDQERVLKPFYRGDAARNMNENDSFGLGLSIAHSIVERNGGRLELENARPNGLIARILIAEAV